MRYGFRNPLCKSYRFPACLPNCVTGVNTEYCATSYIIRRCIKEKSVYTKLRDIEKFEINILAASINEHLKNMSYGFW